MELGKNDEFLSRRSTQAGTIMSLMLHRVHTLSQGLHFPLDPDNEYHFSLSLAQP